MININNSQKGYVLASVITLSALVFIVGSSALYMTSMSSQTVSSEVQYAKAKEASEYALTEAVRLVVNQIPQSTPDFNSVTISNAKLDFSGTSYSYKVTTDAPNNNNCLVYAEGKTSGGARVIQTAVIPIKPLSGLQAAMVARDIEKATINGSGTGIGNFCNVAGVVTDKDTSQAVINELEKSNGAAGTPPVDHSKDITSEEVYKATFGSSITDHSSLHTKIKSLVDSKATTLGSNCSYNPLPLIVAGAIVPSTCISTDGDTIECTRTGLLKKIINVKQPGGCSEVALGADNVTLKVSTNNDVKFSIHAQNRLDLNSSLKGLFASKDILNIEPKGGNADLEGIFIGGKTPTSAPTVISGNATLKGLVFFGNATKNSEVDLTLNGNISILGSLIVDGSVGEIRRNGGGNSNGATYNLQYDHTIINNWGDKYPDLLNPFSCGNGSPSILSSINKTKMVMF